jgi:hypothetical protein
MLFNLMLFEMKNWLLVTAPNSGSSRTVLDRPARDSDE